MTRRISGSASAIAMLLAAAGCAATTKVDRAAGDGLYLCRGVGVSNAPPTDSRLRVVTFRTVVRPRGRMLATAPVAGCLSSGFGDRRGGAGVRHDGIDLSTNGADAIRAAGDGRIAAVSRLRGYGLTVDIDHGSGVMTRYAHLSRVADGIETGARTPAGAVIGFTGRSGNATGVHLHYEIRLDGRPVDPLSLD
ncbi:MAG: peptidoglycan DD-metalloendopeptidase family protein [Alphaproteobacteria bacterium]|nr:peptidoglycan DD-metalloendopeptidase family protein [Alphaproteobacteria bacterium]